MRTTDHDCRHCGAPVRSYTVHARLSAGPRDAHDQKLRYFDVLAAASRASNDRDHALGVIRRAAAARGNLF
jgi:hypothetical protein